MKAKLIILSGFAILAASFFIHAGPAKIFCVNLYSEKFDYCLGELNDPVASFNGLEPFTPSRMVYSNKLGNHTFYFKLSTASKYYFWASDGKNAEICPVEADKTYCFVIGVDSSIEYYILDEGKDNNPKVCFLNGSNSILSRMEVSKTWKTDYVAYIEDLKENGISSFVSFTPGDYTYYWQFPEQVKTNNWYYLPDKSGNKAIMYSFKKGEYYLFLAYTQGRTDYAKPWNISP